jgi:hypothetical protein
MKKHLFLIVLSINTLGFFAQNFQWAKGIGGPFFDGSNVVALDASENVYTTGTFKGTVDFDPGPGINNLTSLGVVDVFISKSDADGNFIWAKSFGGLNNQYGNAIGVDASGNVYVAGLYIGTTDFDPGVGTYTLASVAGTSDAFVAKLDASGNFVWARSIGGAGYNCIYSLVLDNSGNVYTTGLYDGTVDFDPGIGTYPLTAVASDDFFISKLDASGNFVWAKSMGGMGSEFAQSITLDVSGNIYTAGIYNSATCDFDPGPGVSTQNLIGGYDIFVSKLDVSGNFVWARSIGGVNQEQANCIKVDALGNVYTTGFYNGTADFNPGAGTFTMTSTNDDVFISKLDATGNFVWAKNIGGTGNESGFSITLDGSGNVYTCGRFDATTDFDPGIGIYTLTSTGGYDSFISKLNTSGNFLWAKAISGSLNQIANCIAVSALENVYVTGSHESTVNFDPGGTNFSHTTAGFTDIFISKYCGLAFPAGPISGPAAVCAGGIATYTISSTAGASGFLWTLPPGATINAGQNTTSVSVTFGISTGSVTIISSNSCGSGSVNSIPVTVNQLPIITSGASNTLICAGETISLTATGATTFSWNSLGTSSLITVNPITNTTYSVTGTNTNNCEGSSTIAIVIKELPNVTATTSSSLICVGEIAMLTATGAATYSWSNGGTASLSAVSPTINTTYSVTGIGANGCMGQTTILQNVSECLGLNEKLQNKNLEIFPNPSEGVFTIVLNADSRIIIRNAVGQTVLNKHVTGESCLMDIREMPDGVYFIQISHGGLSQIFKLLKH